jgi:hypothetical protein
MFNSFTDNAMNIWSESATPLPGWNFTHNWWGDRDGPAAASMGYLTSPLVEPVDTGYPMGAPGTGDFWPGVANYTSPTTGISIEIDTTIPGYPTIPSGADSAAAAVGSAVYDSNPAPVDPPYPVIDSAYYDIFVGGPGLANVPPPPLPWGGPTDIATIQIPNALVGPDTVVMVWDDLTGAWRMPDQQGVNVYSGSAWFVAGPAVWPDIDGLCGTPVALVTAPEAPLGVPAQDSLSPAVAAEGVRVENASFTWDAVSGADYYEFELAPYLIGGADPFQAAFILVQEYPESNGLVIAEVLDYLETYAWRVRAAKGDRSPTDEKGAWVTGFFTAAAEPEEQLPPVEVIQQEPPVINIPDWPDTIYEEQTPVIPDYLLWVVVGVGAVLVIAVIVLIVRTRRVA